MENQTLRRRCFGTDYGCGDVPIVAHDIEDRGMVFEHGDAGPDRAVLRHGHFQGNTVRRHIFRGPARLVVVPELV